jgi:hypothetical protein
MTTETLRGQMKSSRNRPDKTALQGDKIHEKDHQQA